MQRKTSEQVGGGKTNGLRRYAGLVAFVFLVTLGVGGQGLTLTTVSAAPLDGSSPCAGYGNLSKEALLRIIEKATGKKAGPSHQNMSQHDLARVATNLVCPGGSGPSHGKSARDSQ